MHFGEPWVLLLLWGVPLFAALLWALHRRGARRLNELVDAPLRARVLPPPDTWRWRAQFAAVLTGLLLALLAAAAPRWGYRDERVLQRGRDLVIALDVSRSMLARDVQPSRLERARADIMDLLRVLQGDRVALVAFRGRATLLCPLTTDYSFMDAALAEATVGSAPPGETDLADAIRKSTEAFGEETGSHRAIILISDGEDLAGRAAEAAAEAAKAGIVIFTVGFGDPAGAPIPDERMPGGQVLYKGEQVATRLDHATLQNIAETTGGAYVPVGVSNVRLDALYRDHLRAISARDLEETSRRGMVERFQWFLAPALLAFLLAAGLSRGRPAAAGKPPATRRRRGMITGLLALATVSLLSLSADAETNLPAPPVAEPVAKSDRRTDAWRAWRLYRAGDYRGAADLWRQAADGAGGASGAAERQLRGTLLYNAACALYRDGAYQEAAELFAAAGQTGTADADTLYNQGSAWWQAADTSDGEDADTPKLPSERIAELENAARAFQQAARVNGSGDDARNALEAVAEVLPSEREQARLQKVLEKNAGRPPYELTTEIMRRQRAIAAESAAAQTSTPPQRIDKLEALAQRQRDNADLLGALRLALEPDNSTNVPPQLDVYFQALQEAMSQTRTRMRDLDQRSPEAADTAAAGVYNFWKALAPYQALLQEGLMRQTNALAKAIGEDAPSRINEIRGDQAETQLLTELFLDRFTNAVPETTEPPSVPIESSSDQEQIITPEKRADVIKLAQEAIGCQEQALSALNKPDWPTVHSAQQNSRDLLIAIQKLLAPPPQQKQDKDQEQNQQQEQEQDQQKQDQQQSGGQQDQQDQQEQEQDQSQSDEQKEDQSQPEQDQSEQEQQEQPEQDQPEQEQPEQEQPEQGQSEPDQPEPEPDQSEQEQSEAEQQAAAEAAESDDKEEMTPEQAIRILQRAAEREKEYRRRQQRQYAPLSPTDRDW